MGAPGGTGGASRLRAANSITAMICSRARWNQSMISLIEAPASRLSKTTETGVRVSRNTHAPLRLSATLSTAGHCDQSRVAMLRLPFHFRLYHDSRLNKINGMVGVKVQCECPVRVETRQQRVAIYTGCDAR